MIASYRLCMDLRIAHNAITDSFSYRNAHTKRHDISIVNFIMITEFEMFAICTRILPRLHNKITCKPPSTRINIEFKLTERKRVWVNGAVDLPMAFS